jgi:hypothetical protein
MQRENCDLFGSIDRQAAHARTYTRQFLFADELSKPDTQSARQTRLDERKLGIRNASERNLARIAPWEGGYSFKTVLTYDQRGIRGWFDRSEGKSATMERPDKELEHGKRGNASPLSANGAR